MIEIVLAMTIIAVLMSISIQTFRGQRGRTEDVVCRESLRRIRDAIDAWQLNWKRPWYKPVPPPGAPTDPWTQAYRVDPRKGQIWSMGPDGKFQTPEEAEDLALAYTPFPTGPVGRPRNVRGRPSSTGGFLIMWDWPEAQGSAVEFRISRAAEPRGPFVEIGTAPPDVSPEFKDHLVPPGKTMYYRVEAVMGPGSTAARVAPSQPYALTIPQSSIPGLSVEAGSSGVLPGVPLMVRVSGKPHGASLQQLVFDGQPHAVGPGAFSRTMAWVPPGPGVHDLEVQLLAVNGLFASETLTITGP